MNIIKRCSLATLFGFLVVGVGHASNKRKECVIPVYTDTMGILYFSDFALAVGDRVEITPTFLRAASSENIDEPKGCGTVVRADPMGIFDIFCPEGVSVKFDAYDYGPHGGVLETIYRVDILQPCSKK